MSATTHRTLKRTLLGAVLVLLASGVAAALHWQGFDLASQPVASARSTTADLDFMHAAVREERGRILAVVTSTEHIAGTPRKAGFELTELARAYYTFEANGYRVDIASPLGGMPPMRVDEDLVAADHAFLNDRVAMRKLEHSLALPDVDAGAYAAVYLAGGKGTLFDFPDDIALQRIVRDIYQAGGVIGAVCHGPAGLLNVRMEDGRLLVDGRRLTGFTNAEELFLIKDARDLFPYLLQDQLVRHGARFQEGSLYLDNTVVDGRLVSGQNPWSTWSVAEAMIRVLGHVPVQRERSSEERSVAVLAAYHREGAEAALRLRGAHTSVDRRLLLMHALIAGMQGRLIDAWRIQALARP